MTVLKLTGVAASTGGCRAWSLFQQVSAVVPWMLHQLSGHARPQHSTCIYRPFNGFPCFWVRVRSPVSFTYADGQRERGNCSLTSLGANCFAIRLPAKRANSTSGQTCLATTCCGGSFERSFCNASRALSSLRQFVPPQSQAEDVCGAEHHQLLHTPRSDELPCGRHIKLCAGHQQ